MGYSFLHHLINIWILKFCNFKLKFWNPILKFWKYFRSQCHNFENLKQFVWSNTNSTHTFHTALHLQPLRFFKSKQLKTNGRTTTFQLPETLNCHRLANESMMQTQREIEMILIRLRADNQFESNLNYVHTYSFILERKYYSTIDTKLFKLAKTWIFKTERNNQMLVKICRSKNKKKCNQKISTRKSMMKSIKSANNPKTN